MQLMGVLPQRNKEEKEGVGNPTQEGAGLYSNTEIVQSAMIETSPVILYLWQCYAPSGVISTQGCIPKREAAPSVSD